MEPEGVNGAELAVPAGLLAFIGWALYQIGSYLETIVLYLRSKP